MTTIELQTHAHDNSNNNNNNNLRRANLIVCSLIVENKPSVYVWIENQDDKEEEEEGAEIMNIIIHL